MQNLALCFIELQLFLKGPSSEFIKVPLKGTPLFCINCTTQLGVVSKLAKCALNPITDFINEDVKVLDPIQTPGGHCFLLAFTWT